MPVVANTAPGPAKKLANKNTPITSAVVCAPTDVKETNLTNTEIIAHSVVVPQQVAYIDHTAVAICLIAATTPDLTATTTDNNTITTTASARV